MLNEVELPITILPNIPQMLAVNMGQVSGCTVVAVPQAG